MGISKRNPRGNFNWQSRILKKKAQCCGLIDEPLPPQECSCHTLTVTFGLCRFNYADCAGSPVSTLLSSKADPLNICALGAINVVLENPGSLYTITPCGDVCT